MKKLMLTLAGAMALSFTANAVALFSDNEKWFDGGIKDGWPTTAENGGWSNTNGTTYAESKLTVSALAETPLTFTADVAKVTADYKATISSTVGFTAFEELPVVPDGAKAGVISYGGNFYAIAINEDGANAWKDTGITASDEAAVDISFLDPTKVVYTIGGTPVTNTVAEAAQIQNVCITGDGTLAGLKATAEQKAVTFTIANADHTTKEVSGAELVEGTTYKALPGAEVIVTYTADFGYFFADGSKTYIVDAEAGQGITIEVKLDRVVAAAKIGDDKDYFTLTNALAEAKSGDTVTLLKDAGLTEGLDIGDPEDWTFTLTLDLNGKTISTLYATTKAAYDAPINVFSNATLTITGNGTIAGWTGADAAALDGKSIIAVDGAKLYFENGTLTAGGIGSDGMYGVYAFNDSIVRLGIADDTTKGPTITTWFAAVGSNNTTAPCMITIWGGTYTQLATPAEGDWWHYFCAPVYAAAAGGYTIKGGTFTGGLYSISAPYADAAQTIALDGGTFNQPLYASEKQGVGGGTRIVTKAEGVTIAAPAGYEWRDNVLWKLIAVESVTLDQTAVTTNIGETVQLTMTYAPEDADVVSTNWTSSAETVATVDQTGLVTAVAEGEATITVTVTDKLGNEKSATCTFTVAVKGPTPAPGSQAEVVPVEGEKDTYIVNPTGEDKTVAVQGVKSGDTLVIDGQKVDSLGVNDAAGVTVKVTIPNETTPTSPYDITAACKGWDGTKFSTELDPEAVVEIETESGTEQIPVKPALSDVEPFVVGTTADVTIKTIPGLTYQLTRATEVQTETYAPIGDPVKATAARTALTDADKPAGKAFYKTQVTK